MSFCLGNYWANPSSESHSASDVRHHLDASRQAVAALVGASTENIVFTSGGTESNNLAILSGLDLCQKKHKKLITTEIEHASIQSLLPKLEEKGVSVVTLKPDVNGQIKFKEIVSFIDEETSVVSLQWANNETGVLQPVNEVARHCKQLGVFFHTDASQFVGKGRMNFSESSIDALTLTGHKFHGPKGIGAVVFKKCPKSSIMLFGGSQEMGVRPGTENVQGIIGMGTASESRRERLNEVCLYLQSLRDRFEKRLCHELPDIQINGVSAERVPNTSNVLFPRIDGAILVHRLDMEGIECSQTSACTQARPEPSHVLTAMGLSEEEAYSSVRFSFSELNNAEELDLAVKTIAKIYKELVKKTLELVG